MNRIGCEEQIEAGSAVCEGQTVTEVSRAECEKRAKAGSAMCEDNTQETSNSAVCDDQGTDNIAANGGQTNDVDMVDEKVVPKPAPHKRNRGTQAKKGPQSDTSDSVEYESDYFEEYEKIIFLIKRLFTY